MSQGAVRSLREELEMVRLSVTPVVRTVRTLGVGYSEPRCCYLSPSRAPPPWSGRNRLSRRFGLCLGTPEPAQN